MRETHGEANLDNEMSIPNVGDSAITRECTEQEAQIQAFVSDENSRARELPTSQANHTTTFTVIFSLETRFIRGYLDV